MPDDVPPELLLEGYPDPTRDVAQQLRLVVRRTMPDAVEKVRAGWSIIGYDVKLGRRSAFFAWVMPQFEHVHLGFPYGVFMADPDRRMDGAGIDQTRPLAHVRTGHSASTRPGSRTSSTRRRAYR